ncbi:hypothetical protein N271_gp68 [Salmonella phage Jersey]|uniref:Uncharacterized protein n=1 Tax=Salmonella phage Jersey TaxID=1340534 RepID=S4X3F2_9CAUD|nr:hypothetical protein N271_gp68 [Salmonella phage Jersey]AGP24956.1 hypothetical protein Jersey_68 [Salmonella phage Jersey]
MMRKPLPMTGFITDREYEKMMVDAASGRSKIEAVDAQINAHQAALDYLNEYRRELINRYDLNKCGATKR